MFFCFKTAEPSSRNFVLLNRAFNTFKSTTTFLWRASLRLELSFMTCLRNDKRVEVPLLKFQLFAYWSVGTQEPGSVVLLVFSLTDHSREDFKTLFGSERFGNIVCRYQKGFLHNIVRGKKHTYKPDHF